MAFSVWQLAREKGKGAVDRLVAGWAWKRVSSGESVTLWNGGRGTSCGRNAIFI